MVDKTLGWEPLSEWKLLETRIFTVCEGISRGPSGQEGKFVIVDAPDWAMVVPLIEGPEGDSFLMVRQFRHGSGELSLEFPGGVLEDWEVPAEGVLRELREETGYEAADCMRLGSLWPNPAFQRNKCHIFLARGLRKVAEPALDSDEFLEPEIVRREEFEEGMGRAPLTHSLMVVSYALFERWERRERGPR